MATNLKSEVELLTHANNCLNFFAEYRQDNATPEAYVGARYCFKFPNNFIVSFVASDEVYLYSLGDEELTGLDEKQWTYLSAAGSWKSNNTFAPEDLCETISEFSKNWGKPELNFPWLEWMHRYGPLSWEWEDFQETRDPEEDFEEIEFFQEAKASELYLDNVVETSPDGLLFNIGSYASGNYLLPPKCDFVRLQNYLEELRNNGWIIIDNVTNQDFAFQELESKREEESDEEYANGNPGLLSPLESVWQCYLPSGELNEWFALIDSHVPGDLEELQCAERFGFKIEINDKSKILSVH